MEAILSKTRWFFSGLALFSLFFGAGNIIFPLIVGKVTGGGVWIALVGFCITAVLIPLSGLLVSFLYKGDFEDFFLQMGRIPGKIMIWSLLLLIGPFGGIPRCISLTYATFSVYFPNLEIMGFASVFALVVFFITLYKPRGVWLLTLFVAPVIFCFLVKGMFSGTHTLSSASMHTFSYGLKEGHNTMDFLWVFFFASVIFQKFREEQRGGAIEFVKASLFAAFLLAIVYVGFALVGAIFSKELASCQTDHLIGELGSLVLGKVGGFVVSSAVLVSCLVTAAALTSLVSNFIRDKLFRNRVTYDKVLILVLGVSILMSMLSFSTIVSLLSPILLGVYLLLLVICILIGFKKSVS